MNQRFLLFLYAFIVVLFCSAGCRHPAAIPTGQPEVDGQYLEETDNECSYFYFLWGRHAELQMNYEEALEAYEKALICDPQADYISRKVPILLLRLNRIDEAVDCLTKYLDDHPAEIGSRMLLAKMLIRQEKFDQAAQQYLIVHEQNPDDLTSLLLLSELYLTWEKNEDAREVLQKVLSIDESSYPAHVLLARLNVMIEKEKAANKHYARALEINWSAGLQLEISELYLQQKKYDKAIAGYRDILTREKTNEEARIALVHVYLLLEKEELALKELDYLKSITEHPERVDLTIARLYARRKQFEKAAAILQDVLKKENLSRARYLLAIIYFQTKQYDEALAELELIRPTEEEYEDRVFLQVRILRVLEQPDDAIILLEQAIERQKTRNADMYVLLAALYQLQGKGKQGEETFARGFAAYPGNDELLYEYGLFLDHSGEQIRSMSVMQQVIEMQPHHAAALNYVGYTWADKQIHLDKALDYIKRAVALEPENGYIRDSLGWVYFRLGRLDDAMRELEEAIKLSPDDPAIYDHLGDVYLESNRIQDALQVYHQAVELYTEDKDRQSIQEKIRILEEQVGR